MHASFTNLKNVTLTPIIRPQLFTRLNHFSLRLRPVGLLASCLTFGITPAGPMLAIRWLACLAGVGLTPTGINDLARPHTPIIPIINNY